MSKKHFIDLANCIKYHRDAFSDEAIDVLVSFCRSQNGRFNEARFRGYIAGGMVQVEERCNYDHATIHQKQSRGDRPLCLEFYVASIQPSATAYVR